MNTIGSPVIGCSVRDPFAKIALIFKNGIGVHNRIYKTVAYLRFDPSVVLIASSSRRVPVSPVAALVILVEAR
jgi:hypothetical protein